MPKKIKNTEEILDTKKETTKKTVKTKKASKSSTEPSKVDSKKTTTKKATNKKTTTKKNTSSKGKSIKSTKRTTKSKKETKSKTSTEEKLPIKEIDKITSKTDLITLEDNIEYYDLPYIYNQTVVKLLFQTPNVLFVYWNISDEDRENFITKYGKDFFNNSIPILIVKNLTRNHSYEIEVNDFANSWYIHTKDTKCEYTVELCRKPRWNNETIKRNGYIHVTTSNKIESPNDHVLFENKVTNFTFKNVKTNSYTTKSIKDISIIKNLEQIYNVENLFEKIYENTSIKEFLTNNPSSNNFNNII